MARLLIVLFITICTNNLFGQLVHNDPFKIDNLLYLDIEYSHSSIVSNKISSVEKYSYSLTKRGKKKGKGTFVYAINFNKLGYPISFNKLNIMDVWWLYKLNPPRYCYDYYFAYDTLNRLIGIKETIKENKHSHHENDIRYSYDSKGRVIQINSLRKYIYQDGFKYRGATYLNDTSLFKTTLVYKNDSIISTLIGESFVNGEKSLWRDSLFVNLSFDSLFMSKTQSRGIKKDSAGNIIESSVFRILGKSIGGECIYSETETEFTTKYIYNSHGVVIKSVLYDRNNKPIRTVSYTYGETGLIDSILTTDFSVDKERKRLTVYKYNKN